jgi:hypothetical protein
MRLNSKMAEKESANEEYQTSVLSCIYFKVNVVSHWILRLYAMEISARLQVVFKVTFAHGGPQLQFAENVRL